MPLKLTDTTHHPTSGAINISFDATADQSKQALNVTYPDASTNYRITSVVIPPGSKFHPGAHWHEDYDEYMRVLKGRARIRLGNDWKVYTPEDGEVRIPKGTVHDVMRADMGIGEDDGDLVMEERGDPVDGSKELFFRHAFSIAAEKAAFGWKLPLQMLLLLMYTDNYMVFVPGTASWYFTHGFYAVVKPVAKLVGLTPFYDEYTPGRLMGIKRELEGKGKGKRA